MPSVAINGYIYKKKPVLSPSGKGVLLKNHPQEGWPGSVPARTRGRRSKTLDLHNEELLLVLGVLVQMSRDNH
jgi:hypothetical protein